MAAENHYTRSRRVSQRQDLDGNPSAALVFSMEH